MGKKIKQKKIYLNFIFSSNKIDMYILKKNNIDINIKE